MAYQIVYKKRFTNKLVELLQYLESEWNEKVATDFLNKLDNRIEILRNTLLLGNICNKARNKGNLNYKVQQPLL